MFKNQFSGVGEKELWCGFVVQVLWCKFFWNISPTVHLNTNLTAPITCTCTIFRMGKLNQRPISLLESKVVRMGDIPANHFTVPSPGIWVPRVYSGSSSYSFLIAGCLLRGAHSNHQWSIRRRWWVSSIMLREISLEDQLRALSSTPSIHFVSFSSPC